MPVASRRTLSIGGAATALLSLFCAVPPALGQTAYPVRPITMVVAFAAGGGTDTTARLIAKELTAELGQPIIVENRAGAGGSIGAASVARAPGDGYTLLFGTGSEIALLPAIKPSTPYDPVRDFEPIGRIGINSFLLVAHPSVAANTIPELIALARSRPGELTYASFGVGATNHLLGELFSKQADVRLLHVPYKGSALAVTDLLSGQVNIAFDTVSAVLPYVQSGKLKALAVLSPVRSTLAPEVPTTAESGLPGLVREGWLGLLAPRNTPPATVERLNVALARILESSSITNTLAARGVRATYDGPEQFRSVIKADTEHWKDLVKTLNIQLE